MGQTRKDKCSTQFNLFAWPIQKYTCNLMRGHRQWELIETINIGISQGLERVATKLGHKNTCWTTTRPQLPSHYLNWPKYWDIHCKALNEWPRSQRHRSNNNKVIVTKSLSKLTKILRNIASLGWVAAELKNKKSSQTTTRLTQLPKIQCNIDFRVTNSKGFAWNTLGSILGIPKPKTWDNLASGARATLVIGSPPVSL